MQVNYYLLIGAILIIAGATLGTVIGVELPIMVELSAVVIGAVVAVIGVLNKHEGERTNKFYLTVSLIVLGAIIAGIGGMNESIATGLIGAAALIAGVILSAFKSGV